MSAESASYLYCPRLWEKIRASEYQRTVRKDHGFPVSTILVRPRVPRGLLWRLLCSTAGCRETRHLYARHEKAPWRCEDHRLPTFEGVPLRRVHLRRLQRLLCHVKRLPCKAIHFYIRCEGDDCTKLVDVTLPMHSRRRRCRQCRGPYVVAGRRTTSQAMWNDRKRITMWKARDGRLHPHINCSGQKCTNKVLWRKSLAYLKRRFCSPCNGRNKRLRPHENAYKRLQKSAIERGLSFTLTFEQFSRVRQAGRCRYCDTALMNDPWNSRESGGRKGSGSNLDRKDNLKGYEPGNCVPSCYACNSTKDKHVHYTEMLVLGAARTGKIDEAVGLLLKHQNAILRHGQKNSERRSIPSTGRKNGGSESGAISRLTAKKKRTGQRVRG